MCLHFLKTFILMTRRYIILNQGFKLNFWKPSWLHKTGCYFFWHSICQRRGHTALTSEPKIIVISSTWIFSSAIWTMLSYGTSFHTEPISNKNKLYFTQSIYMATWGKHLVHNQFRSECLTFKSIRSLGGVESYHSVTTMGGRFIRRASTKYTWT